MSRFEPQTFHGSDLKLKQYKHTRLLYNIEKKTLLIIFYNHYLLKFSKFKNQVLKLKFQIKVNYSTICCRNGKGTTISFIHTKKVCNWSENQVMAFTMVHTHEANIILLIIYLCRSLWGLYQHGKFLGILKSLLKSVNLLPHN